MHTVMRKEREARNWSQGYVAKEVGITREAVSMLENGTTKPSYAVLVRLEDLFQMGHRELFKED